MQEDRGLTGGPGPRLQLRDLGLEPRVWASSGQEASHLRLGDRLHGDRRGWEWVGGATGEAPRSARGRLLHWELGVWSWERWWSKRTVPSSSGEQRR